MTTLIFVYGGLVSTIVGAALYCIAKLDAPG